MRSLLFAFPLFTALAPAMLAEIRLPLGLDLYRPIPEDNPVTAAKVKLGKKLFGDKLLGTVKEGF